jgi:hypothetical protein
MREHEDGPDDWHQKNNMSFVAPHLTVLPGDAFAGGEMRPDGDRVQFTGAKVVTTAKTISVDPTRPIQVLIGN